MSKNNVIIMTIFGNMIPITPIGTSQVPKQMRVFRKLFIKIVLDMNVHYNHSK